MEKLNITFCSTPDYTGNAKELYNYMIDKYKDKMNFIWAVKSDEKKELLKQKNIKSVVIGTDEFKKQMKKTDVFFTTHCNLTGDINKKSLYIELWHGVSSKKLGFMMNNISEQDSSWYDSLSYSIDYFIVPSEFWKLIFACRFRLDLKQILPIGYPKLKNIKNKDAKKNLEQIIDCKLDKYKKIIFYTPTFRKGCGRKGDSKFGKNILNLEEYDEKELEKYLEKNKYLLCIKKHPSEESNFLNKFKNTDNIKLIKEEYLSKAGYDIYNILDAADVLITDYSSLGMEFLYLNKNVIYLDTDKEEYMKNRGICYENFDFWTSNTGVSKYDDFIKLIDKYLKDDKFLFQEKKEMFFGNIKDGGCKDICDYFFTADGRIKEGITRIDNINRRYKSMELKYLKEESKKKQYEELYKLKEKELKDIYNSKAWKLAEKLRKIKKKIFR